MKQRRKPPTDVETRILVKSKRRCCLCFGLDGDDEEKPGQIVHLDRDPSNSKEDNLAWLCIPHHDRYDSRTSQSKGLTLAEVKQHRKLLYAKMAGCAEPSTVGQEQVKINFGFTGIPGHKGVTIYGDVTNTGDRAIYIERVALVNRIVGLEVSPVEQGGRGLPGQQPAIKPLKLSAETVAFKFAPDPSPTDRLDVGERRRFFLPFSKMQLLRRLVANGLADDQYWIVVRSHLGEIHQTEGTRIRKLLEMVPEENKVE